MKRHSERAPSTGLGTQRLCSEGLGNTRMFLEHFLYIWNVISNLFYCLHSSFSSRKICFCWGKKKTTFSIIIALWTITGQVLLACLGYLAVSPGIAQICYQELGYTIANGNSVSPWLCNEFSFSSNWKLSCEQTWQGTGHSRQVFKRSFKKYFSFCRKTRLHPRGKNVV